MMPIELLSDLNLAIEEIEFFVDNRVQCLDDDPGNNEQEHHPAKRSNVETDDRLNNLRSLKR